MIPSPDWHLVDPMAAAAIARKRPPAALRERASLLQQLLLKEFPVATCALDFRNPFELLSATILSAQCTDERVNMVTPRLFATYPTPAAMASAPAGHVEELIRSTGFFNMKG
jgi:endonuclease-3